MLNALVQDFSMQLNLRRSFSIELPALKRIDTVVADSLHEQYNVHCYKVKNTKCNANQQVNYPRTVISAKYVNGFIIRDGRVLGPPRADKLGAFRHFLPTVDGFEWAEVEG